MNPIKINGGSFDAASVLSYKTEDEFVSYYSRILHNWLDEKKRELTLRQVYKIAHDLKKKEDDSLRASFQPSAIRRRPDSKNNDRRNEGPDYPSEPTSDVAGNPVGW